MPELNIYVAISALSGLIILSYIFSLIAKRTRIPTVLLLIASGIAIREILLATDTYIKIPLDIIQFFGVIGLIVILLEAGLDLKLSKTKKPLIIRATASSLFVLVLSIGSLSGLLHLLLDQSWYRSILFAIPLSVISSTIVASSIDYLSEKKREFLTYESSLSDIFGVLFFNILVSGGVMSTGLIIWNISSIAIALLLSAVVSFLLIFLLSRGVANVKAFLLLAVLLLVYAFGHMYNLPTLLVVLVFGLLINNWHAQPLVKIRRKMGISQLDATTDTIKSVTAETAFLIRTIFFTLFGYMIDMHSLFSGRVLLIGSAIVIALFLIRYLYLRLFVSEHVLPELFFAPRGLVTVVLFYSIPSALALTSYDEAIVLFVVVTTTLLMMIGSIWFTPHEATRDGETASRGWLHRLFRSANTDS